MPTYQNKYSIGQKVWAIDCYTDDCPLDEEGNKKPNFNPDDVAPNWAIAALENPVEIQCFTISVAFNGSDVWYWTSEGEFDELSLFETKEEAQVECDMRNSTEWTVR